MLKVQEVPIYLDVMRFAFDRLGWNIDDFDVYRTQIKYPLMPSSVLSQFNLREPPDA